MKHEQECPDRDGPYGDDPRNQQPAGKTAVVHGAFWVGHGDAAASGGAAVCWGGIGDDGKTRAPTHGRGDLDAVPEEIGGAFYDEQSEPESLGACCVRPVKSPDNLPQFIGWNADAAIAYLEVHLCAASAAGDAHAAAARGVVNRIAYQVPQHPA
jgi:hypothetical protein